MSTDLLNEKLIELHERYKFQQNDDGYEFSAPITNQLIDDIDSFEEPTLSLFKCFDQNASVYIETKDLKTKLGTPVSIRISPQDLKSNGLNVYFCWKDFLGSKENILNPPKNFLILSEGIVYPSQNIQGKLKHFFEVKSFLEILIDNADHLNKLTKQIVEEIVFLHKNKLEILVQIDEECIGESLDGFTIVKSLFDENSHKEQKKSILKEVLHGFLGGIKKNVRLMYLITNFGEFSKRFSENYNLFVSEFSFDEVRKEYEESKRDYLTKLNDIFSSVQTKMLGIPVSLAVASIKISPIIDASSFWSNLLLFAAVWVYSYMMFSLITNQTHTLTSVKDEYQSQMNRLKHQYSEQYDIIKHIENELNTRHKFQLLSLIRFRRMIMGLLIFVSLLFLYSVPWTEFYTYILETELIKTLLAALC